MIVRLDNLEDESFTVRDILKDVEKIKGVIGLLDWWIDGGTGRE